MTQFIKGVLSDGNEPSSKRVLATVTVFVLLGVFIAAFTIKHELPPAIKPMFDSLLIFAGVCLGLNVTKDIFSKKGSE